MDTTHEIRIGQIVKSKAGRDKNRAFIIIDVIDDQFVLIADGSLRKIEKAKKKKIKHLSIMNAISVEVQKRLSANENIDNLLLKRELEKLGQIRPGIGGLIS